MVTRLAIAVALSCACAPDFTSPSIVVDLRVLALRADPPEIVIDYDPRAPDFASLPIPDVTLTALIADPRASRRLAWEAVACAPTSSRRCAAPILELGAGVVDDPEASPPAADVLFTLRATPELLARAFDEAPLGGIDGFVVQVELRVVPEGGRDELAVFASKLVLFSPRLASDQEPNRNPVLDELTLGGETFGAGDCATEVAPLDELGLEPVEDPRDRELYELATIHGGTRRFLENLSYAWFATDGELTRETTGGAIDPFGGVPPLDTTWTAPTARGPVRFWVVQRDERGGTSWVERCVTVVEPTGDTLPP